ncbi:NitT/TauT family transport system substrate-binding protein [Thiohalospira halophila DSM 15071]|uniref:NitT/TauT family transport system substrate-binding protein n=1 Tax=Thiohalospira halophila DSM 15071 TaxID=1123397 RepID=A0A1I1QDX7_9GAMM|nr:ABC transporter substrate-binding protein [Thiohalospira halophila]SFD16340.1 NitT/TauT family transport system substrate-binding protein [Thiohalospira halophila DSM 15071]
MTMERPLRSLLAALLILLAGCGPEGPDPLRIALNPWPGYHGVLHLAQERGYFAEAGIEVELVDVTSLAHTRRAFERGQVDIFGGTAAELVLAAHNDQREPRAFYAADWSEGGDRIYARTDIEAVADLEGQRVGVEPQSLDRMVLALALKEAGLDLDDVILKGVAQTDTPAALVDGRIDAAVSYPPTASRVEELKGFHRIFDTSTTPGGVIDFLMTDAELLESRRRDLVAIAEAFHRAVEEIRADPAGTYPYMARVQGLSEAELASTLDGIHLLGGNEQAVMADGRARQAVALARDILARSGSSHLETVAPERLVTPRIIEAANFH